MTQSGADDGSPHLDGRERRDGVPGPARDLRQSDRVHALAAAPSPAPASTTPASTAGTSTCYQVASVSATRHQCLHLPVNFTIGGGGGRVVPSYRPITANRTLSADTVYTLSGYVKVQNGVTLTIPAGTTIVGDTTQPGSSLWILRGAKIDAQGTADRPHRLHLGPLCRQPEAG